jgi:hypothetical protein
VPEETMRRLQDMPVCWWERLEAWYGRKSNERLLGIPPLLWFDFRQGRALVARMAQEQGSASILRVTGR